ncbi:MAG: tetratricopeptide repeat protein, partial [Terriglobia bacterium]
QPKHAAGRATAIDPLMGEAWTSLAIIRSSYEWEWAESEMLFKRAIQLNPGYSVGHFWYSGDLLAPLGRLEEAKREVDIARQLDPLSPIIVECDGYLDLVSRRYDKAIDAYREALELDPNYYKAWASIGRALIQKGEYDEAIHMLEKAHALIGEIPNVLGALGQAYALAGNSARARELLGQLEEAAKTRYVTSTSIAIIHMGLAGLEGTPDDPIERDLALRALEAGCHRRELPLTNLNINPVYDSLRGELRFVRLLRRMRLVT